MNAKILIACHKACDVPLDEIYLPLQVGAYGKESIGFRRDDEGDNMSAFNPYYCELTGLYWAWKNLSCDYLGLVHYRRYFTVHDKKYRIDHGPLNSALSRPELNELLIHHKVLVPEKRHYYIETIWSHYSHTFSEEQLIETRKSLKAVSPEYLESFDVFMKGTSGYMFNMFIMPKDLADQYCAWLFPVLHELAGRVDISGMDDFQKRYIGRISERLFNVWLIQQVKTGVIKEEEIGEVPYFYRGSVDWRRKITSFLNAKLFHKKYEKSF